MKCPDLTVIAPTSISTCGPPALIEALRRRTRPPRLRDWTLELDRRARLRRRSPPTTTSTPAPDRPRDDGLDRALVSLSSPLGIESLPGDEAAELLDAWHDGALQLPGTVRAPGRRRRCPRSTPTRSSAGSTAGSSACSCRRPTLARRARLRARRAAARRARAHAGGRCSSTPARPRRAARLPRPVPPAGGRRSSTTCARCTPPGTRFRVFGRPRHPAAARLLRDARRARPAARRALRRAGRRAHASSTTRCSSRPRPTAPRAIDAVVRVIGDRRPRQRLGPSLRPPP